MQLVRPVARGPAAGLALKPLNPIAAAAKGTVPNRACYGLLRPLLLPGTSHSSPLPAPSCRRSVRGTGRRPCPAPTTAKARDEAEREPQAPPPAKQGEEEKEAAPERKPAGGERSMAYQIFAGLYVCAYVFCWRTGELIFLNAQDALDRLRRHVRDKLFDRKR